MKFLPLVALWSFLFSEVLEIGPPFPSTIHKVDGNGRIGALQKIVHITPLRGSNAE